MVGLLLNYSADPSVVDLANVNPDMLKVLQREVATLDVSDNESLSPSSSISSADDSEHDDDKIERTFSSSHLSKTPRRKVRALNLVGCIARTFLRSASPFSISKSIRLTHCRTTAARPWTAITSGRTRTISKATTRI